MNCLFRIMWIFKNVKSGMYLMLKFLQNWRKSINIKNLEIELNKLEDVVLLKPNHLLNVTFDLVCYGMSFFESGSPN